MAAEQGHNWRGQASISTIFHRVKPPALANIPKKKNRHTYRGVQKYATVQILPCRITTQGIQSMTSRLRRPTLYVEGVEVR